ncbi:MAG: dihydrodipicolinate synthase family protein, partial [Propylenella sp.]
MIEQREGHPLRKVIGLSAALATPFTASGEVDWVRFASHAKDLLERGMKVVTAFGTTGEGISIPVVSRAMLYDRMSAEGVAPASLVECVYGLAAADTGQRAKRALETGCAAVLLTPPFYFKNPGEEGLHRWFCEVFETTGASARDIILYNIPQITGVRIELGSLARLRTALGSTIAGVKDSGGDWSYTEALIRGHGDLAILVGHEGHLAAAVRLGASGAISGVANFAPELVGRLVAGADDDRIEPILAALTARDVVPAIKAFMADTRGEAWRRVM